MHMSATLFVVVSSVGWLVAIIVELLREKNLVQPAKNLVQSTLNSPNCMCKSDKSNQSLKVTIYAFNEVTDSTSWLNTLDKSHNT